MANWTTARECQPEQAAESDLSHCIRHHDPRLARPWPPARGHPAASCSSFGRHDPNYKDARLWSLVYWLDEPYAEFLGQAYQAYSSANGLNPSVFKSLKRFETQIIAATAELLHGGRTTCGVVTSGGTESCLLAVKTYRDLARGHAGAPARDDRARPRHTWPGSRPASTSA